MKTETADFASLSFSSGDLPARDRLPFWREDVCRKVVKIDVEPIGDAPFAVKGSFLALPGLRLMRGTGSDVRYNRTKALVAQDGDVPQFGFGIVLGGRGHFSHRERDLVLGAGEAVTLSQSDPAAITHRRPNHLGLAVPLQALALLVGDVEGQAARKIPRENEALKLLIDYLRLLLKDKTVASPELGHLAAIHVHDLIAAAMGATRDGAEIATNRGVRAARLATVKSDILANLGSERLLVAYIARRQGLSPRHLHRLFETEETSFSEFVLHARLARAHRMLTDPRLAHQTITTIALAAGFGDLSHFNRSFRRRYGATPSEVRRGGLGGSLGQF
jgi:AraC-like DNA-binding protein